MVTEFEKYANVGIGSKFYYKNPGDSNIPGNDG